MPQSTDGTSMYPTSVMDMELWPGLIAKAVCKVVYMYRDEHHDRCKHGSAEILQMLTGWTAQRVPVAPVPAGNDAVTLLMQKHCTAQVAIGTPTAIKEVDPEPLEPIEIVPEGKGKGGRKRPSRSLNSTKKSEPAIEPEPPMLDPIDTARVDAQVFVAATLRTFRPTAAPAPLAVSSPPPGAAAGSPAPPSSSRPSSAKAVLPPIRGPSGQASRPGSGLSVASEEDAETEAAVAAAEEEVAVHALLRGGPEVNVAEQAADRLTIDPGFRLPAACPAAKHNVRVLECTYLPTRLHGTPPDPTDVANWVVRCQSPYGQFQGQLAYTDPHAWSGALSLGCAVSRELQQLRSEASFAAVAEKEAYAPFEWHMQLDEFYRAFSEVTVHHKTELLAPKTMEMPLGGVTAMLRTKDSPPPETEKDPKAIEIIDMSAGKDYYFCFDSAHPADVVVALAIAPSAPPEPVDVPTSAVADAGTAGPAGADDAGAGAGTGEDEPKRRPPAKPPTAPESGGVIFEQYDWKDGRGAAVAVDLSTSADAATVLSVPGGKHMYKIVPAVAGAYSVAVTVPAGFLGTAELNDEHLAWEFLSNNSVQLQVVAIDTCKLLDGIFTQLDEDACEEKIELLTFLLGGDADECCRFLVAVRSCVAMTYHPSAVADTPDELPYKFFDDAGQYLRCGLVWHRVITKLTKIARNKAANGRSEALDRMLDDAVSGDATHGTHSSIAGHPLITNAPISSLMAPPPVLDDLLDEPDEQSEDDEPRETNSSDLDYEAQEDMEGLAAHMVDSEELLSVRDHNTEGHKHDSEMFGLGGEFEKSDRKAKREGRVYSSVAEKALDDAEWATKSPRTKKRELRAIEKRKERKGSGKGSRPASGKQVKSRASMRRSSGKNTKKRINSGKGRKGSSKGSAKGKKKSQIFFDKNTGKKSKKKKKKKTKPPPPEMSILEATLMLQRAFRAGLAKNRMNMMRAIQWKLDQSFFLDSWSRIVSKNMLDFGILVFRRYAELSAAGLASLSFAKDEQMRGHYQQFAGRLEEKAAGQWFILFKDVLRFKTPTRISARLRLGLPEALRASFTDFALDTCVQLSIVNNDTMEYVPSVFGRPMPHTCEPNTLGYTIIATARAPVALPAIDWALRLLSAPAVQWASDASLKADGELPVVLETGPVTTKSTPGSGARVVDPATGKSTIRYDVLFRYELLAAAGAQTDAPPPQVCSFHFGINPAEMPDAVLELELARDGEVLFSRTGKHSVTFPLVQLMGSNLPPKEPEGKGKPRSAKGAKGAKKGGGAAAAPETAAVAAPEIRNPYVLRGRIIAGNKVAAPAPDPVGSPAKKKGAKKGGGGGGAASAPEWKLQACSDFELRVSDCTAREQEIREQKDGWECVDEGRSAKAQAARTAFTDVLPPIRNPQAAAAAGGMGGGGGDAPAVGVAAARIHDSSLQQEREEERNGLLKKYKRGQSAHREVRALAMQRRASLKSAHIGKFRGALAGKIGELAVVGADRRAFRDRLVNEETSRTNLEVMRAAALEVEMAAREANDPTASKGKKKKK